MWLLWRASLLQGSLNPKGPRARPEFFAAELQSSLLHSEHFHTEPNFLLSCQSHICASPVDIHGKMITLMPVITALRYICVYVCLYVCLYTYIYICVYLCVCLPQWKWDMRAFAQWDLFGNTSGRRSNEHPSRRGYVFPSCRFKHFPPVISQSGLPFPPLPSSIWKNWVPLLYLEAFGVGASRVFETHAPLEMI